MRRAASRTGELAAWLAFGETLGVCPGFMQAMSDRNTAIGSVLVTVCGSVLFDLFELVTAPDRTLRACSGDEPELPMR